MACGPTMWSQPTGLTRPYPSLEKYYGKKKKNFKKEAHCSVTLLTKLFKEPVWDTHVDSHVHTRTIMYNV